MTTSRKNTLTSAVLVLLCLVLISAHMMSGIYAKFAARSNGNDDGRIAVFSVLADAEKDVNDKYIPVSIASVGDNAGKAEYKISIANPGETAVLYVAELKFHDDAPESVRNANQNLKFSGSLAPKTTEEKTLSFNLDISDFLGESERANTLTFRNDDMCGGEGSIPFDVVVAFTQVD